MPVGITPQGAWVLTDADPQAMRITGGSVPEVKEGTAVVLPADPDRHGLVAVEPGAGVQVLETVDVVFPVLHGRFGEDGTIQGLLEMAGIPYVGPGVFASAAAMDKEFTKKLLRGRRADGRDLRGGPPRAMPVSAVDFAHLGLPVFVKPARAGSSVGITKVTDWADLPDALDTAFEHDNKVLIEAAVVGREIECGVLENENGRPEASLPAEIRLVRGHDWYDFEAKYLDDACEFDVPAHLPAELTAAVQDAACRAFTALDCAGLARVDFFVTAGRPRRSSTRSTRCPGSRRSRCSRRCGRRPASTTRRTASTG